MNTDHLPRHIVEHVNKCDECLKNEKLCPVGSRLLADFEHVKLKLDKGLRPLKDIC
jgi:hypothetical protein